MNNKGFTLIELVGIVLILALIFLISFPNFVNMASSDEKKKYDSMVKNLCIAGEAYIYSNTDEFNLSTVGSTINVDVQDLIVYGNVSNNLKNPTTGSSVKDDTLVFTIQSDKTLSCEYIDN